MATNSHAPVQLPSKRWLVIIALSLLLHLLILNLAGPRIGIPSWHAQDQATISAQLQAPQAALAPAVQAPTPAQRHPKPRPTTPHAIPAAAPTAAPAAAPAAAETLPPAGMEAPGTSVEAASELPPASAPGPDHPAQPAVPATAPASAEQLAAVHYAVSPPPPAALKYDVQALRAGQKVYGNGKIRWQTDGNSYRVDGEAGVLFFTVLNFSSEGQIDPYGVAPLLYTEKRFRKAATNTHFQRERNAISFSASTASYPRHGGEQDRASVIWQLAGIGRGDSAKFVPGAEIDLFVAGVRDAETWRIRVVGQESIALPLGETAAWHLVRVPRAGSYEQQLDIWLAPQREWYPLRLRYTDTNGDYLDMAASEIQSGNPGN